MIKAYLFYSKVHGGVFLQGYSFLDFLPGQGCTVLAISAWARVSFLTILIKERSNFGNSCIEAQYVGDFGIEKEKFGNFNLENTNSLHF